MTNGEASPEDLPPEPPLPVTADRPMTAEEVRAARELLAREKVVATRTDEIDAEIGRRRRLIDAKRKFDEYLELGAVESAVQLYNEREAAGEGWALDSARLQTVVDQLQKQKRWEELAPFMDELVAEATRRSNALRITLAQICVKKLDRPARAIELLSALDHRSLTAMERDLAMEMMGRARVMQAAGVVERDGPW